MYDGALQVEQAQKKSLDSSLRDAENQCIGVLNGIMKYRVESRSDQASDVF